MSMNIEDFNRSNNFTHWIDHGNLQRSSMLKYKDHGIQSLTDMGSNPVPTA